MRPNFVLISGDDISVDDFGCSELKAESRCDPVNYVSRIRFIYPTQLGTGSHEFLEALNGFHRQGTDC